ncbi:hypothetical protein NHX12_000871 [Muraenolepis orangiensis]|uniref:C-type lectin domain-containing protein n=1 Tax=Muraenolepis orangiensis TaxID=630683 RepID=A0A9Q0IGQ9_9TELE|nr:hypothetical protein NHX12_000871 [Muraenolepis orangiensis]
MCSPSFCGNYRQHCLVKTPKPWRDAKRYCRQRGFDLATIDDMGAMESLLPLIPKESDVWIGLRGGGPLSWYWSLADTDFYQEGQRDYRNFQLEGSGNSAYFLNGQWTSVTLTERIYAMCYDANKRGEDKYVLVRQLMTGTAAREYCREHHTDMVAIRNQTENQIIHKVSAGNKTRHTVEHRISDINAAIEAQLHSDLQTCEYFSVALDESCDIQDKPQLAIFARSVSNDCVLKEELLDIVPLKDRTRGIDVKGAMMNVFVKPNVPKLKLTAIATDGAPSVVGSVNGLGHCKTR